MTGLRAYVGSWLGRAPVKFTHHPAPVALEDHRAGGGPPSKRTTTDLLKVCEQSTPPCNLNPLFFNGHAQTVWGISDSEKPAVYYRRRVFHADHHTYKGTFAVDFAVPPFAGDGGGGDQAAVVDGADGGINGGTDGGTDGRRRSKLPPRTAYWADEQFAALGSDDDSRPQLIVLHGLSGGSHEAYLRDTIEPLLARGGGGGGGGGGGRGGRGGGWEVCVLNARGCAGSTITTGVLYNARATWDLRQLVGWMREKYPNRPLFALGFSLGANIMTNYIGEEGSSCPLKAAVSCSNPFNLDVVGKMMRSDFIGREIYLRAMGRAMRALIDRHKEEILAHTNLDWDKIQKAKYLQDFDREVHCKTWGYMTVDSYYRDASCSDSILAVRIPYLAINATDDPIALDAGIPYDEFTRNPYTVLLTTPLGGHLGWREVGGVRWFTRPICNFLNKMAFEVSLDTTTAPSVDANGPPKHGHHFDPMRRKLKVIDPSEN